MALLGTEVRLQKKKPIGGTDPVCADLGLALPLVCVFVGSLLFMFRTKAKAKEPS